MMEYIAIGPGILCVLLGGAVWGLVALLCARRFTHGEERTAIEQVGLRPMLTGAVFMLWGMLTGLVTRLPLAGVGVAFIVRDLGPEFANSPEANFCAQLISPGAVIIGAVVHIATMVYLLFLESERSFCILAFPFDACMSAFAKAIGEKDERFVNAVHRSAKADIKPAYTISSRWSNSFNMAFSVVMVGLWITLFVLVNR